MGKQEHKKEMLRKKVQINCDNNGTYTIEIYRAMCDNQS